MRIKLLGLLDVLIVTKAEEIRWLNAHPDVVRPPDARASVLHWLVNQKTLRALRFDGEALPVFVARDDVQRARDQAKLADALDEPSRAPAIDAERLGAFVAGSKPDTALREDVGVQVQDWCGGLCTSRYRATKETYDAGRRVAEWPAAPPWKTWGRARQQLEAAKQVLSAAADHDLQAVHATSIAGFNVIRSVYNLRALADRAGIDGGSAEQAVRQCLVVPPALVRGCRQEIRAPFLRSPLRRNTLVIFLLARAYRKNHDIDLAFLQGTWSACPARHVVPAMLEAVWNAAIEAKARQRSAWAQLRKATDIAKSVSGIVSHLATPRHANAG